MKPSLPTLTRKLATVCFLTGLAILVTKNSPALAQVFSPSTSFGELKEVAISASPTRVGDEGSLTLKPGEKTQISLKVRNTTNATINVISSVEDMLVEEDGTTPYTITGEVSNRWGLASWITLAPSQHTLEPRETAQLSALIEVPEDALPGGHYAIVLHKPSGATAADDGAATGINQRTGTLIYVIVSGEINEEAFIRDFNFPKFSEYGPVPFSFTLENRSDVHIRPRMSVEISNILGRKVETIVPEQKNIFPYTDRDFSGEWTRIWGFGPYKAKLIMTFGTKNQVAMTSATFWLLPIKLVAAGVVILLAIIISILSVRKHLAHRAKMQKEQTEMLEKRVHELESQQGVEDETSIKP